MRRRPVAYGHSTPKLRRDFRAYVSTGKDDFEGNYTEKIQGLGLFIQKKEGKGDAAPVRVLRSCCLEVAPRSE